jgi:hypothetical protein
VHEEPDRGPGQEQARHLAEPDEGGQREPGGGRAPQPVAQGIGELPHHRGGERHPAGGVRQGRRHQRPHKREEERARAEAARGMRLARRGISSGR